MKKREDIIGLILEIAIITLFAGLTVMKMFGYTIEGLIAAYKARKEMETITYGASVSKVNKYIEARNKKVNELNYLTDKKAKELNTILYYTNDTTTIKSAIIQANREYRDNYVNPYKIGRNYIAECEQTIKYINEFNEKADSLGYNIFIDRGKGNEFYILFSQTKFSSKLRIKNINKADNENKYKVVELYYYSDKTKQHLAEQIKKRKPYWFNAVGTTPEKEIALLDKVQYSTNVFTEKELQEEKLNSKDIRSLYATRANLSKNSTFYFSCYNKKMDSLSFLKKIELFKKMFLKQQPNAKGEIRAVKVISHN